MCGWLPPCNRKCESLSFVIVLGVVRFPQPRALSFSGFYRLALMCLSVYLPICIHEALSLGFPLFARVSKGLAIPTHWLAAAFYYPIRTAHTDSGFFVFFFAAVYILIN